jgi:signal transduction histidine kinase
MTAGEYELFWEMLVNKQVVKGVFINKCKDRKLVTIEGSANPVLDENGDIYGFLAIQRDITQRVEREERSRQRNKELAALYKITTTVSQSLDLNQILNTALEEVLQLDMFGGAAKGMLFRLDEEVGELLLISNRGAPKDHPCLTRPVELGECLCGFAAQQRKVVISEDCFSDTRHGRHWPTMPKHKDICLPLKLRERVLGVMNVRLPATHEIVDHDVKLLTSVADQIGVAIENARLFGEQNEQHKQLRKLSTRLAEAEETERKRLAQELHDQVGQKLTALGINLNILRTELSEEGSSNLQTCLAESQDLVAQMAKIIRGVMADLRPPMLDDLGLQETLYWFGDLFASRTGISVSVESNRGGINLPYQVEIALYRITQEALTNVVKHARATEVVLFLESDDKCVRLIISDNGVGCSLEPLADSLGDQRWGLLIMAERAEAVGGRCWMATNPTTTGMRVIAEIPR